MDNGKGDWMSEEQELILELLHTRNKFKSDPISVISLFQRHFLAWLEGLYKFSKCDCGIFEVWDNMRYEDRTEVCIKFLKEGKR